MQRRKFLLTPLAAPLTRGAEHGGIRSIIYNVLACLGYPRTEHNRERFDRMQPQQPDRMVAELLLYQPDIVTFCESVTHDVAQQISRGLGMQFAYFPPGVASYTGYPIGFPGTVFTKHRIVESRNAPGASDAALYTRHWGRALLATPREEIAVFSAHLHPRDAEIRRREIDGILRTMERDMKAGRSILFQGDLNHTPEAPEYQRWLEAGLVDTFATKGVGQPYTSNPIQPRSRIDYIWAHGPIAQRLRESRCLFEGAFRTNPSDPLSVALSDHLPVLAVFG